MRIKIRNRQREALLTVTVDPRKPPQVVRLGHDDAAPGAGQPGRGVHLHWDQALDDRGHLRRCPVCQCRELFVRKDFPQVTGLVIVVTAAAAALWLFAARQVLLAAALLGAMVLVDALIFVFAGRCLVCYRCRSEFRDLPIRKDHPAWDLAVGEKYREPWRRGPEAAAAAVGEEDGAS